CWCRRTPLRGCRAPAPPPLARSPAPAPAGRPGIVSLPWSDRCAGGRGNCLRYEPAPAPSAAAPCRPASPPGEAGRPGRHRRPAAPRLKAALGNRSQNLEGEIGRHLPARQPADLVCVLLELPKDLARLGGFVEEALDRFALTRAQLAIHVGV